MRLHIANAFLTRKLLVNNRRLLVANIFSTSVPRTNISKLLIVNAFLTNAPPRHDGRRPQQPSSFGFAATAFKFDSPGQLHSGSNMRWQLQ